MKTSLSRAVYRLILRLHPASFRDRFGEEMLWIFDEECKRSPTARLLFDGFRSAVRQHFAAQEPRPAPVAFAQLSTGPEITPLRLAEAGVIASLIAVGFMFVAGHPSHLAVPPPKPQPVRHPPPILYSPSHIEPLSKVLK